MLLMLDNYDSFTYNLVHLFEELGIEVRVVRNDAITVEEAVALQPSHLVVSPGPGRPADAGISIELIRRLGPTTPTLGVCLGLQGFAHVYGARVVHAKRVMHGKVSMVTHGGAGVLAGLPNPLKVGRYHSLAVEESSLPADLVVTARTVDDGEIMGLAHARHPIESVQFHPESILTESGKTIIENFVARCRA